MNDPNETVMRGVVDTCATATTSSLYFVVPLSVVIWQLLLMTDCSITNQVGYRCYSLNGTEEKGKSRRIGIDLKMLLY